ncbi:heavy metal translocating P-type ATPase [Alteribacter lacisalsi]|uniref:Cd(2+)-exporting ATPase n=1 Tax=Alteribacter lacisalsi TaxID=2045244 RepID=A0A2W0HDW3_9BACI|nr:heavy metal translocating P-type ATPase [Alteribacter lacisalsi]PYZ95495.1 heavy metal translocating P-type ATPase [Alteribacter lacisalsi]
MTEAAQEHRKKAYRVRGFTCASCAAQFEDNVRKLDGVISAEVDFASGKLSIEGAAGQEEIERAGAFENLRVYEDGSEGDFHESPYWQKKKNLRVAAAALLTAGGWVSLFHNGEENTWTISLFVAAILLGGYALFFQGVKNLVRLRFDMKTLMTIAIIGAALIGEWGEAAVVVVLFALSEALETYSMDKARRSLRSLIELAPRETTVLENGTEIVRPVSDVRPGDLVLIRPGEKIPVDGTVEKGASSVNEAAITGESIPAGKTADDTVFAGTMNEEGILQVRVTKTERDTALAGIIHLVEKAQSEKAPAQQFVDRFARVYTPAIVIFAALIATVPPLFFGLPWNEWVYLGLATLVVGCPCALVISTPVAIVTAIGHSARQGVLIKGGVHMEQAGRLTAFAFDKTGTLTRGTPEVTDVIPAEGIDYARLARTAFSLERHANHPLAKAIASFFEKEQTVAGDAEDFETLTGAGVRGAVDGERCFAASDIYVEEHAPELLSEAARKIIHRLQQEGKTVVLVGTDSGLSGILALRDEVKPGAADAVRELTALGIRKIVMLTGDHPETARAIGEKAGIEDVRARLLPEDKLIVISDLKKQGYVTGMAGDGMNDAPALAAADTSVAMGLSGTDVALETADISLMGDDLEKVPYTIRLSRKTMAVIKQNIVFSLALKAIALLLVPFGLLTLWIAIFADIGATLLVTLNSLRLLKTKKGK